MFQAKMSATPSNDRTERFLDYLCAPRNYSTFVLPSVFSVHPTVEYLVANNDFIVSSTAQPSRRSLGDYTNFYSLTKFDEFNSDPLADEMSFFGGAGLWKPVVGDPGEHPGTRAAELGLECDVFYLRDYDYHDQLTDPDLGFVTTSYDPVSQEERVDRINLAITLMPTFQHALCSPWNDERNIVHQTLWDYSMYNPYLTCSDYSLNYYNNEFTLCVEVNGFDECANLLRVLDNSDIGAYYREDAHHTPMIVACNLEMYTVGLRSLVAGVDSFMYNRFMTSDDPSTPSDFFFAGFYEELLDQEGSVSDMEE